MPNYGGINSGLKNRTEKPFKVLMRELWDHHKRKLQEWNKKPLNPRWMMVGAAIVVIGLITAFLIFDHLQNVGLRYLPPRG